MGLLYLFTCVCVCIYIYTHAVTLLNIQEYSRIRSNPDVTLIQRWNSLHFVLQILCTNFKMARAQIFAKYWGPHCTSDGGFIHRCARLQTRAAHLVPRRTYKISILKEIPRQLLSRICTENTNINITPSLPHYFCVSAIYFSADIKLLSCERL